MVSFVYVTLILGLITKGLSAPIEDDDAWGHRDSTKAILNLEQELKQSAGEDKKFAPPDDTMALAQLAAEGAKQQKAEQDQAELDELSALNNEAPGGLTLEQMHALENEPVADVDPDELEQLEELTEEEEQEEGPEVEEENKEKDEDEKKDTFKEKIGIQSDKKSPYKVVAVSEKKSSSPVVPPHMDMSSDDYPEKPQHNEEFMEHFLKVIKEYPELMEFMNDPEAIEQYERMVLSDSDYLDRDEALKAEMLAAQSPEEYPELQQYNDYSEDRGQPAHDNREVEQEFGAHDLEHAVRAKKRGYDTPQEYLEWVQGGPHANMEVDPEDLQVHTRAAELMQPLSQRSAEEEMSIAM